MITGERARAITMFVGREGGKRAFGGGELGPGDDVVRRQCRERETLSSGTMKKRGDDFYTTL